MKAIAQLADEIAARYYDTVPKEQTEWKMSDYDQYLFLCAEAIYSVPVGDGCAHTGDYPARARVVNEGVQCAAES